MTRMNKMLNTLKLVGLVIVPLTFVGAAPAANAGGGYRHHDGGHNYRQGRHGGYRHNNRHRNRHHRRYSHGYYGYSRHRGHRRHRDRGAYLAGGLVIGSLLTHAYHRSHDARPYYSEDRTVTREVIVRNDTGHHTADNNIGRRLFKDINGNCFERAKDASGAEILIDLPAAECNW